MSQAQPIQAQIDELLITVQSGLEYLGKNIDGISRETSMTLFQDIVQAILSISLSLQSQSPPDTVHNSNVLETSAALLMTGLEGFLKMYQEYNTTQAMECLTTQILPSFAQWKAAVRTSL